ncbi:SNF1-related protein kinase regulatory subunit beta-2 [Ipomoea triloba]|uniref:SNF1-related protein kinase regulatory subunit beta-2 n=1 Tax=Ipomoea triloba TaxID=35885 RepID=UPI00125DC4A6|nr:SNF1-related protein kinase regulatory subunit beta-2 [Ipomoea triloba]GLL37743.1 SNF1-related protein kinase regulatory subunit beta-2 [Ipomoea trifida]GMD42504.1 SNF1-related protein kinase regulatory subunit beta-2-like [Ipomoea batatas]GMD45647.1 SNF1-related protein kinase regulatory subunit beta-2-like [Ipomoea batatas]GMD47226.1 SNF1-related protein kinase regulatory subunit beta-2-like [Ipomoea batatas]GMD47473.1 SNF1-related protein kinase regulatory subunit beta-2-like [Ipomoea ba
MGNVNGREEDGGGGNSPSRAEESGAAGGGGEAPDSAQMDGEFMGQSPPSSPRASRSPLMFRPQMPVVPLQRPDELHIPNPPWMQTASGYDDMYDEQRIPTVIIWGHGGKEVSVEGSWDDWKTRKPLQRSGKDFTIMKVLPSGVYQYRFIVDGQWRYSPDVAWITDEAGNYYNVLDLQEYVPEDIQSISGFEPPLSPDSSYSNLQLGAEDYAKEPPLVPPHLQLTLLNVPSSHSEIPPPFSRPQHVVLNHLYMQRGRSTPSVVALGSTHRFLSKYVTVVLYKSIER